MLDTARLIIMLRGPIVAAIVGTSIAACASSPPDDLQTANQPMYCRSGDAPSCIEKVGQTVRCFCADKEALRELLDPDAR